MRQILYSLANWQKHTTAKLHFVVIVLCCLHSCQQLPQQESAKIWDKVHINFKRIDKQGLAGPADGKVAVNYEFCIPAKKKYWVTVRKTDPSAKKMGNSRGRIACQENQWLIIGSTHQTDYLNVIYNVASLPFVNKIEETFWE